MILYIKKQYELSFEWLHIWKTFIKNTTSIAKVYRIPISKGQ